MIASTKRQVAATEKLQSDNRPRSQRRADTLRTAGRVFGWLWSHLVSLLVLALIAFVLYCAFIWSDSSAVATMRGELDKRAFTNVTVVDEPTQFQTKVFGLVGQGNQGTYSATAGNCRFIIETPDGTPTVTVKSAGPNGNDVVIGDADMTKLSLNPATRGCF